MTPNEPAGMSYERFAVSDIADAVASGWRIFRDVRGPSIAYGSIFGLIGLVLLAAAGRHGFSPMALPLAGGFMLVGPPLLAGFFRLAAIHTEGGKPRLRDALGGLFGANPGLWAIACICALLFLIWISDAAVLYAFLVGGEHLPYRLPWLIALQSNVIAFELWAAILGSVLAFIVFCISAFSVPLLYEGRAPLVRAVHASIRAVLSSLGGALAWALFLTAATLASIVLLPAFPVAFPILAYASFSLYRRVFPIADHRPASTGIL